MVRPINIVTRQSTDILSIEDKEVAEAVRFIRKNSRKTIRVNDVADASGLSRRVLEKRFRKVLNRSVHEEIRRVRIAQVCRMLVETTMSISEITLVLGYPGVEHIARYFRKEKGMSLLAYRKEHAGK